MKFYLIECKHGHVGRDKYLPLVMPVHADSVEQAIRLYGEIHETYIKLVKSQWGRNAIAKFNELLPDDRWISDTKKIDFFIWKTR